MELSEAGALAFLAWWVDMYNYVEATGETDLVFEHSEPGCTFCQNFVDRVEPVYEAGGRIERDLPTRIDTTAESQIEANGYILLNATAIAGPSTTIGDDTRTSPETSPTDVLVGLQWTDDGWLLVDIATQESA